MNSKFTPKVKVFDKDSHAFQKGIAISKRYEKDLDQKGSFSYRYSKCQTDEEREWMLVSLFSEQDFEDVG